MLKIKNLKLGNIARAAVSISDTTHVPLLKNAKRDIDLIEVRVDKFKSVKKDYIIKKIKAIKTVKIPIIATIRKKEEGGFKNIDKKARLELFRGIIPLVDAIDIELSAKNIINLIINKAHKHKKKVIVSYHNFKNTPSDKKLTEIIKKAKHRKADIVKIAVLPKNKNDILRLLSITQKYKNKNLITICMGPTGIVSRVLFPFFGSLLSYAYLDKPSAPGQLSLNKLKEAFKLYYK
jgi:3-dehydroquinate dehydratase-1